MKIINKDLPNFGLLETKLDKKIVSNLFELIEKAKKDDNSFNNQLVGNISSSLTINDDNKILHPILLNLVKFYKDKYGDPHHSLTMTKKYGINIDALWVNFQKQGEFNPPHNHSGAFSFVIWMKIPTNFIEQKELSIAKNSSSNLKISNFSFLYNDISGKIREFIYQMDENKEGLLLFFPSLLIHQVYPFFNNSETRISVAGNLGVVEVP